ncbi:ABC transporter ATP-binding protein [Raineyella fluvialis]|uniref:ATP-binding cassette domain-containing protein n=1 Tax=Raineyella fluvialis TaxID=2662261 RepID=A0A5Q2FIT5_9ACTN|nr:ABC transporter ATP-binding protein [Raineyella fluvialis]QGF24555.1 ATP-binding cassette domain-containing protein [Raineyella fluvialis]
MADIAIRNLMKTYPGTSEPATKQVSLEVDDGEFMVLLGPSGCGKTTLLRMVAGLDFPDSGSISIGGRDVTYLPPNQRNLSMVFQSYAVFPHRKVRDNIGFGLTMRKMSKAEIAKKVDWAADLLQLSPYLDRFPANLSGGQRQRVAVARAIVVDADVLLMDEPLSNLDALLRLSFRAELKKIVETIGTTTVYVTHDQVEALSLGDRVAVMRVGQIAQLGRPLDVYDSPADTFVGGFIGSPPMNFLDGTVADGRIGFTERASVPAPAQLPAGPVRVGIRAEAIVLGEGTDSLPAVVDVVEPIGSHTLLTVTIGDQVLKVQVPPTTEVHRGDTVTVQFPPGALRLYDPETGLGLETS